MAWIDRNIARNGTEKEAKAYLEFLYTEQAQRVLASYFYRVHNETVVNETAAQFPATSLFTVEDKFGGWEHVNKVHFANNAELDQLLAEGRR